MTVFKADPAIHRDQYGLLVWGKWYYTRDTFAYGPYENEVQASSLEWGEAPDEDEDTEYDENGDPID